MAEEIRFPIRISENGVFFEDQDGKPFLWHADTCWRLFWMMSYEEACFYLRDRAEKGFTVIQVHLLPHHVYQTNVYGENPFTAPGMIDSLNEEYFFNVDRVIAYAGSLGLAVAVAPMWLSTWEDDWHRLYRGEPLYRYARQIAQRYGKFSNVIAFIHGGDDDAVPLHDEVNRCVPIYKKYAKHVLNTFHAGIGPSYPMFGEKSWYDFCMNYTYDYGRCIEQMLDAKKKYPHKPAVLGKTHYDGNDGISSTEIRRYAYTSVILGGAGQTYGNKDIWMANMFWKDALYTAAAHHMTVLREVFEHIPWYRLIPDAEGTLFHTVRALMPNASDSYIPAASVRGGMEIVAYVSDRRFFTIRRDGCYAGEWIDPVRGRSFRLTGKTGDILHIPGHNAGGSDDWILHAIFEDR